MPGARCPGVSGMFLYYYGLSVFGLGFDGRRRFGFFQALSLIA
jgi:hypothetical protein